MMESFLRALLLFLLYKTEVEAFGVLRPRRSPTARLAATSTAKAEEDNLSEKIPIHLFAGFLGSGKTTTLKNLLENTENSKIGVIVNDVASVNIDAKLVNKNNDGVVELQNGCACCSLADELLTSMENLLRSTDSHLDAIIVELSGVADPVAIRNNWKQAVATQSNKFVTSTASLENVVTLVDACTFGSDFMTWDVAWKRWDTENGDCTGNRQVVELLTEQVEAANLIIVNKKDLASESELEVTTNMVKSLNKDAQVLTTSFGKVSAVQILELARRGVVKEAPCEDPDCTDNSHAHSHDHSASDPEGSGHSHSHNHSASCDDPDCTDSSHSHSHNHACEDPACTDSSHSHSHDHTSSCTDPECTDTSHSHSHDHATSTDNLGISSFVFKATRPFNADRLAQALNAWPVPIKDELDIELMKNVIEDGYTDEAKESPFVGVLRSKGFCWVAPTAFDGLLQDTWRHNTAMYWSHAGKHFGVTKAGPWWDLVDDKTMREFFSDNPSEYKRIKEEDFVSEEFGDRRQEIVFIGVNLHEAKIREALNACLLEEGEEMKVYRENIAMMQQEVVGV